MTAPMELHQTLMTKMRAAFDVACPDVPLCKNKVEAVFREIDEGEKDSEGDLYLLAMLAFDLGLDISIKIVAPSIGTTQVGNVQ